MSTLNIDRALWLANRGKRVIVTAAGKKHIFEPQHWEAIGVRAQWDTDSVLIKEAQALQSAIEVGMKNADIIA